MTEFRFKKNQRVRLKDQPANLYHRAFVGSEGWVRECREDEVGFPMVKIEWDKEHWAYNGERDMWTFEEHFEPVESEESMPENNDFLDRLAAFIAEEQKRQADGKEPQDDTGSINDDVDRDAQYLAVLDAAVEYAREAEAFLLVAVRREHSPVEGERFMLVPDMYAVYKAEDAGILLETQLAHVAATFHQELAGRVLGEIMRQQRGDSGTE
jgi:hypothetical protein